MPSTYGSKPTFTVGSIPPTFTGQDKPSSSTTFPGRDQAQPWQPSQSKYCDPTQNQSCKVRNPTGYFCVPHAQYTSCIMNTHIHGTVRMDAAASNLWSSASPKAFASAFNCVKFL